MPRADRSFEEGRTYHLYNRVAGGAVVFDTVDMAGVFRETLRAIVARDGVVVLGWSLLGDHFHLILRQGAVPLSRSMKSIQQRVTRQHNRRASTSGPLWQGRFKAKEVGDREHMMQLVAYVHLNPVKAGLVAKVDEYRWSGHRDIIGRTRHPIVAVDDVLLLYGSTRREALRCYRRTLAATEVEDWSTRGPGALPWWRLGRPTKEDRLRQRENAFAYELGRSTARRRPHYEAGEWLELACDHLKVELDDLKGRGRNPRVVRCRELVGMVGVERFAVKVTELAELLGKSRDGVGQWIRRGIARRSSDPGFAAAADALDLAASEEP